MASILRHLLFLAFLLLIPLPILAQTLPTPIQIKVKSKAEQKSSLTPQPQKQNSSTPKATPKTTDDDDSDEAKEADEEGEEKLPQIQQNPFKDPQIDQVISGKINDDLWVALRGGLPCLELSRTCLNSLQDLAIASSPLLKELDSRISEGTDKATTAKVANQKTIQLDILSPALQYLLNTNGSVDSNGHKPGFFERLGGLLLGKIGIVNDLLSTVGIPIFNSLNGGSSNVKSQAIQISDLQVRIADLQRARAELADKVKEKVTSSLTDFDNARVEYQMSQVMIRHHTSQFQIYQMRYLRGANTTEEFLQQQNQLDKDKTQVYGAWAKLRRSLFELKLLALAQKSDD